MKIKYSKDYLSVKTFNEVEISDFSILTGLNGSGKTHFLYAISNGSISIEDINASEIKYYNYNDFIIKSDPTSNREAYKGRFNSQADIQLRYINEIKGKILNDMRKLEPNKLKLNLLDFWNTPSYDFDTFFGDTKNFEALNKIKSLNLNASSIPPHMPSFSSQFFSFIQSYLHKNGTNLNDITYEAIKTLNDEITQTVEEILQKYFSGLYIFLKRNRNGSLFPTSVNDFEDSNFSINEIEDLQKDFEILRFEKLVGELQNDSIFDINKQQFEQGLGLPPIGQINEALNEYDCNGYYLTTNNFKFPVGLNRDKVHVPIQLINKATGLVTSFDLLSSGEKTLIALTYLIYKSRKGKIIPRVLLLDEIDASLHPSMIKRLLEVIQNIFVEKNKIKVILATHSPTTVALAPENSIYVLHKDGENKLTKETKTNAINILTEGFATLDQGLKLFDQIASKKICVFSEGNNIKYLKKANDFFGTADVEFMEGLEGKTGKDQLVSLFNLFSKFPHISKVFFVWDCDVVYKLTDSNNTFPYTFTANPNSKAKKGIENLFDAVHFKEQHYDKKEIDYGGSSDIFNKGKFEADMLQNGTKEDFVLFKPLFDFINSKA